MSIMKPSLSMMDLTNMARISSETPGIRSVTRTNPSFYHGHEFGAIGWLCETPQGVRLFPLAAKLICPRKNRITVFRCSNAYVSKCLTVSSCLTGVSIVARCLNKFSHKDIICCVPLNQTLFSIKNRLSQNNGNRVDSNNTETACCSPGSDLRIRWQTTTHYTLVYPHLILTSHTFYSIIHHACWNNNLSKL